MIKAVIFDMDGVIADTEGINYYADKQVLKDVGFDLSEDEYLKVTGTPARQIYTKLMQKHNLKGDLEKMLRQREKEVKKNLNEMGLQPTEGLLELFEELRKRNLIIALATSSTEVKTKNVLEALKFQDKFDKIITGNDIINNKPAPDIYLKAAKILGLDVKDCVAVEDSQTGVKAAKAAGMKCIALKTEKTKMQDISIADEQVESIIEVANIIGG